jgi:hypothetical protein
MVKNEEQQEMIDPEDLKFQQTVQGMFLGEIISTVEVTNQ